MTESGSLSQLCSICYTEKPKYKCPRCETQTCSLPCYKTHQQRASCNGQRDPSRYLKKSQLATPSGLDQDFNYLNKIGRAISSAEDDVRDRGMTAGNSNLRGVSSGWRPDSRLQSYLNANRIRLERAPHGMARQRENTTRSTKSHQAMWTVEWVTDDGQRETQHDCVESSPISTLFATSKLGKARMQRLQVASEAQRGVKRKHSASDAKSGEQAAIEKADRVAESKGSADAQAPAFANAEPGDSANSGAEAKVETEVDASSKSAPAHKSVGTDPAPLYYYLLNTGTVSTDKVLVPLDPKAKLTDCLRDQKVLEFPTLYVLSHSPDVLPPGFMTAEKYAAKQSQPKQADPVKPTKAAGTTGSPGNEASHRAAPLDAAAILNMLKRDVASR